MIDSYKRKLEILKRPPLTLKKRLFLTFLYGKVKQSDASQIPRK